MAVMITQMETDLKGAPFKYNDRIYKIAAENHCEPVKGLEVQKSISHEVIILLRRLNCAESIGNHIPDPYCNTPVLILRRIKNRYGHSRHLSCGE